MKTCWPTRSVLDLAFFLFTVAPAAHKNKMRGKQKIKERDVESEKSSDPTQQECVPAGREEGGGVRWRVKSGGIALVGVRTNL